MTIRNLGQIATRLLHAVDRAHAAHEDLAAFHAPGECGVLVAEGIERDWRELVAELEIETGLQAEDLVAELESRCGGKFLHWTGLLDPLTAMIQHRENLDRIERRAA